MCGWVGVYETKIPQSGKFIAPSSSCVLHVEGVGGGGVVRVVAELFLSYRVHRLAASAPDVCTQIWNEEEIYFFCPGTAKSSTTGLFVSFNFFMEKNFNI